MFKGSFTAIITPFDADGEVDAATFKSLVERQITEGTHGLVPCGTTGESPTLTHDEHMRVTELCLEAAGGRVPVIAGTGSNSTAEAVMLTRHAQEAGANGALVVTPYYNKPTQEGIYRHFKAVHDATDIPIVIYNIPGRCVVDMTLDTLARLAELPRIVGVKDATNDLTRPAKTRLRLGERIDQLSGEDGTVVPFLVYGGIGCISVTANLAPGLCAQMHNAWIERDLDTVLAVNDRLMPVHEALFVESSPGPVKYAAELMGLCSSRLRLPMCEVSDATKAKVKAALTTAGLLD